MAVLNVEEMERQAIATFVAATSEGAPSAGAPPAAGAAVGVRRAKGGKPGAKKKGGKKGKAGSGAIESELNVYGVGWGLGVAALGAVMNVVVLRVGLGADIFRYLFGGYLTLIVMSFVQIIGLGISLYLAAWFIDEKRYPIGNVLIITGLVTWVPKFGFLVLDAFCYFTGAYAEIYGIFGWLGWVWMGSSAFAIFKGLMETENEGFIWGLVLMMVGINYMLAENLERTAGEVAEVLRTIASTLGII